MSDQKPPRLVTDETSTVRTLLQFQRDSLVRKVDGVDDEAARRSPVGTGTSLLWLVKHMAKAEQLWILHRFADDGTEIPDDDVRPEDTLAAAVEAYRQTWQRVDATISISSLDETCRRSGDDESANLRWVLMHLLQETARHAGHADIIRELIDGQTGR